MKEPILMTEEYWANTQLSVVRYSGSMQFNGHKYTIVNKEGIDVFTLSAKMKGEGKVIEAGEPCDLVMNEFIPFYKKLGRDRFIQLLKALPNFYELKESINYFKEKIREEKALNSTK